MPDGMKEEMIKISLPESCKEDRMYGIYVRGKLQGIVASEEIRDRMITAILRHGEAEVAVSWRDLTPRSHP